MVDLGLQSNEGIIIQNKKGGRNMGIIKAVSNAVGGTFADQWKDIITAGDFDEHTVVVPGILKNTNNGRGANLNGSKGIISNGSKIFVPENTAAFIFSQSGIENVITNAGGYEYQDGEASVFNKDGITKSIFKQAVDRIGYGGISSSQKEIAFVNLREIRDIKFGTRGPQVYNDIFYGCDLEIYAYGSFTIKITDAEKFIRNFVPANTTYYSFDDENVRSQVISDFIQSFIVALNSLSDKYRVSQLPSHAFDIALKISEDAYNAGTWCERFGFKIVKISIENIDLSPESRELINQFNSNKMNLKAYDDVSKRASDISAQQKIAEGIQNNGFGDGMGGMIFGMNMAQNLGTKAEDKSNRSMSFDEQIETLKKLKDLVDMGVLTQEEFDIKKKEIMGL